MSDLHELSAAEQVRALGASAFTSRELTEHYLARIERLDGPLGAFATVTADLALAQAARADAHTTEGERAPLLGLPLGIKDLYPMAGARTTFGSAALAEFTPPADSWTVGLVRQAGAVVLGKTNAAELGATCYTHNAVTSQPTVTPYAMGRYASGSSGGAAAAVAAGLLPVAHASDGAGSTRTPAATCHLVGVKPSRGLVTGAVPVTSLASTTTEGPIARTVEDAALLLDVMARPWCGDLYGWRPDGSFVEATRRRPPRALRVAVWTDTGLDGVRAHPEAVIAAERTAAVLERLGHRVDVEPLPVRCDEPVRQALHTWFAALVDAAVASVVPGDRTAELLPYTRHLATEGQRLSGRDVLTAQGVLAAYAGAFLAAFDHVDVAVTPTTSGPPVRVGHFLAAGVDAVTDRMLAWSCYTPWANFTGQPAISLPSHLDGAGLPYGAQIVGRPRRDADLFSLAAQLEEAAPWNAVHPPCWDQ